MAVMVDSYTISSRMDNRRIVQGIQDHHHAAITISTTQLYSSNSLVHFQLCIAVSHAIKQFRIDGTMRTFIVHKNMNVPFATKCSHVVTIWKPIVKSNMLIEKIYFMDILYICDLSLNCKRNEVNIYLGRKKMMINAKISKRKNQKK